MSRTLRVLLIVLFALGCAKAPAQDSKDLAMVVKTDPAFQKAAKMNVLYVGTDNPVTVYAPNIAGSRLFVRYTECDSTVLLLRADNGTYTVHPRVPGFSQIAIYNGEKMISSERYRCKNIPDPVATLNGKHRGGNLTPAVLQAQIGLVAVLDNFDFDARISIDSYTMTYISKGEKLEATQAGNAAFSTKMKSYIARAAANDVYIFGSINIRYQDGRTASLPPISFIVTDDK